MSPVKVHVAGAVKHDDNDRLNVNLPHAERGSDDVNTILYDIMC